MSMFLHWPFVAGYRINLPLFFMILEYTNLRPGTSKYVPVHVIKAIGRVEVWLHLLVTSVLDDGYFSASSPTRFVSAERAFLTNTNRGLCGTQGLSRRFGEQNCHFWESNHNPSVVQPVATYHIVNNLRMRSLF